MSATVDSRIRIQPYGRAETSRFHGYVLWLAGRLAVWPQEMTPCLSWYQSHSFCFLACPGVVAHTALVQGNILGSSQPHERVEGHSMEFQLSILLPILDTHT